MTKTLTKLSPIPDSKENVFQNFPDWYLKKKIEEATDSLTAGQFEDGRHVFKALRAKALSGNKYTVCAYTLSI